jgi:hypothetical protein
MRCSQAFSILAFLGFCALPALGSNSPTEVQDLAPPLAVSTAPALGPKEKTLPSQGRTLFDPSRTISQVILYDEYRRQMNGDGAHYLTTRFDFSPMSDLYFRWDVPYVVSQPKNGAQEEGLGDLFWRGLYRFKEFTRNALRAGFDSFLDTSKNGMGDGTNVIGPIMNGTFVVNSKVRLQPWILY